MYIGITTLHISIRHSICPRPILDMIKVATHMLALIIGPIPAHTLLARLTRWVESENVDITQAH